MKATQILREQLGLSQQALAQYLSITQSLLGMYEIGERDLPTLALVKLAGIELLLNQNQSSFDELELLFKNQKMELKETLIRQAKELVYRQMKEQRVLDTMTKKYNQGINLYRFVNDKNNTQTTQIEALTQQSIHGIKNHSLSAQLNQKIKLQGIKSQLEFVQQQIQLLEKA